MDIFITVLFTVCISLGIFMVFIPFLPGLFYMFVLTAVFAAMEKFQVITVGNLVIFASLVVVAFAVDSLSGLLGAKWGGASKKSMAFGIIGLLIGLVLMPPFGGIVGLFAGVLFGELYLGRKGERALKAATGSIIGSATGMLINFILALFYFILFLVFLVY